MIKFLIEILTLKKIKTMTKHKDKKNLSPEVTEETKAPEVTEETKAPEVTEETKAPEVTEETKAPEEIDHVQFSIDMMNAFVNSTEKLKGMQKQFSFNAEHYISVQIVENERLLAIIEMLKPKTDGE